ncbi:hypothetical protein [Pleionea sediminis]|uniref:hypothetical protein n=1 Tax=Pleionea sediminis TaxID=2569479 RepID=UPI001185305F|nr:hypothetical protein [Pleionea sediminis]
MKYFLGLIILIGVVFLVGPEFLYLEFGFNTGLIGMLLIFLGAVIYRVRRAYQERRKQPENEDFS